MSPESNEPPVGEVLDQLSGYGRWLEGRTDVPLGPLDLELATDDADPKAGAGSPRTLAIAASCAALVVLLAVGLGVVVNQGDDGATVAADELDGAGAIDTPTSDAADGATVPEPRSQVARTEPDERADAEAGPPPAADGGGDDPAPAAAGEAPADAADEGAADDGSSDETTAVTEAPATGDQVIVPSTEELPEAPWTEPGSEATTPVSGGLFLQPTNGARLDLAAGASIQVREVAGAVQYAFEGWQGDRQIMAVTGANRTLLLPSPYLTNGGAGAMEAGALVLSVTALDGDGNPLAEDSITVTMTGRATPTMPDVTTRPTPTDG